MVKPFRKFLLLVQVCKREAQRLYCDVSCKLWTFPLSSFLSLFLRAEPDCTLPEWRHKKRAGPASPAALMRASKWRIKDHHHPITSSRLALISMDLPGRKLFLFLPEKESAILINCTHVCYLRQDAGNGTIAHFLLGAPPKTECSTAKVRDNAPFSRDNSPRQFFAQLIHCGKRVPKIFPRVEVILRGNGIPCGDICAQ
jgi:hypothetical protein